MIGLDRIEYARTRAIGVCFAIEQDHFWELSIGYSTMQTTLRLQL